MTALNKQALNPAELESALLELKRISEQPAVSTHYARVLRKHIANLNCALGAAEKRIAELQIARDKCFLSGLKTGWEYGIADDTEGYNREIADAQAVIDRAAGIGVKGE